MNRRLALLLFLPCLITVSCRTSKPSVSAKAPTSARLVDEGFLTCFAPGTSLSGQLVWCEVSAVVLNGQQALFANDKDVPAGLSPVFSKPVAALSDSTQSPAYLTEGAFIATRKYEDFAQTPDQQLVLLTTAFDRVKSGSSDWDGYNTVLYWPKGHEHQPRVLAPSDTARTSIAYRQPIAQVLANDEFPGAMPYFKIEGLAATDKHLLFGIREEGQSYDNFKHRVKVISVSYKLEGTGTDRRLRLQNDWKLIADFNPASVEPSLPGPLALSSLEYDPARGRFWLLTSLEANGQVDAYLWTITQADLFANKPFTLIRDEMGKPLHFGHKAEDLTLLAPNRLLVVHDDDRVQTTVGGQTRQPNQAAYTVVEIR
ncbi:hypothetical protein DYU11_00110 [Fibrisoma montanum]|uniref:DUF4221 domain-containing protein n=1 Tax=Fibrisoma montanum TaxID=2305895 RepID=A0A418MH79_9BACT|nr:hypothetical protein [Fibrisoma montanum]RIV26764.1 hypothetical protein DYU11_00110 [Fibrisoma montanum]